MSDAAPPSQLSVDFLLPADGLRRDPEPEVPDDVDGLGLGLELDELAAEGPGFFLVLDERAVESFGFGLELDELDDEDFDLGLAFDELDDEDGLRLRLVCVVAGRMPRNCRMAWITLSACD